jgi:hypothetical protein
MGTAAALLPTTTLVTEAGESSVANSAADVPTSGPTR